MTPRTLFGRLRPRSLRRPEACLRTDRTRVFAPATTRSTGRWGAAFVIVSASCGLLGAGLLASELWARPGMAGADRPAAATSAVPGGPVKP